MPTAEENASYFSNLLRTTTIPQGKSCLAKVSVTDTGEIKVINACCMGVITLDTVHRSNIKITEELEIAVEGSVLYSRNEVNEKRGLNFKGKVDADYFDRISEFICESFSEEVLSHAPNLEILNDVYELSFDQIATVVDAFPKAYFSATE